MSVRSKIEVNADHFVQEPAVRPTYDNAPVRIDLQYMRRPEKLRQRVTEVENWQHAPVKNVDEARPEMREDPFA